MCVVAKRVMVVLWLTMLVRDLNARRQARYDGRPPPALRGADHFSHLQLARETLIGSSSAHLSLALYLHVDNITTTLLRTSNK